MAEKMIWDKKTHLVTIQYHGDPSVATTRPHGNSKTNDKPLVKRSKAVLEAKVRSSEAIGPHTVMVDVNKGTAEGMAVLLT
jgi:hypothetical protein